MEFRFKGQDMSFKIGDIVKLKSGGPNMTIKHLTKKTGKDGFKTNEIESINSQWFAGKKLDSGFFPIDSIIMVTEESK